MIPNLADIHTIAFDFDGVFTDNKVYLDQDGKESVRCDRADGLAFDMVRSLQNKSDICIDFFILSKESNDVVIARANKMKLKCYHGIGNKLIFMEKYLTEYRSNMNDPFNGLIYMGNDLNDFPIMMRAGYSVAPQDAHPRIRSIANLVLTRKGGDGCVREFIEKLFRLDLMSKEKLDAFISNC